MYKSIFETIVTLGTNPVPTWKKLAQNISSEGETFLSRFVYPLIGMTTLANFIGILWNRKGFQFEYALKSSAVTFVTLFAAFFLASYILNKLFIRYFNKPDSLPLTQQFVGYTYSFSYVIQILQSLLPSLFFLKFALLYVIYVIWVGSDSFMNIPEKSRIKFMAVVSFVLFVVPILIEKIFFMLMPRLS